MNQKETEARLIKLERQVRQRREQRRFVADTSLMLVAAILGFIVGLVIGLGM